MGTIIAKIDIRHMVHEFHAWGVVDAFNAWGVGLTAFSAPARERTLLLFPTSDRLCCKRRGVGPRQTVVHGDREPIAFLVAWFRAGALHSCSREEHIAMTPTDAEVAKVISEMDAA